VTTRPDQLALVQVLDALAELENTDRWRVLDAVLVFYEHPGLAIAWRTYRGEVRGFLERETVPSRIGACRPDPVAMRHACSECGVLTDCPASVAASTPEGT